MYICLCKAITDTDIKEAAKNGATSIKDLRRDLQLSIECGHCVSSARKCLKMVQQNNCQHKLQAA